MDAKPQRPKPLRTQNDENAPILNRNGKTIHQRNKSSPALFTADGNREAVKRAALLNVSNRAPVFYACLKKGGDNITGTRAFNDENALPTTAEKVLPFLDQLPVNPRKPAARRNTVSKAPGSHHSLSSKSSSSDDQGRYRSDGKSKDQRNPRPSTSTKAPNHNSHPNTKSKDVKPDTKVNKAEATFIEDSGRIRVYAENKPAPRAQAKPISEPKAVKPPSNAEKVQRMSGPELLDRILPEEAFASYNRCEKRNQSDETWDRTHGKQCDAGYESTYPQFCGIGNTTLNTTTTLFPEYNDNVKYELALAKQYVEATENTLHPDDDDDECSDPTMVKEYGEEIFDYMRKLEIKLMPNPHYMDSQTEIQWSMRSVLVDWVIQVHLRFNLQPETLFLSVNYVDRFLSCKVVSLGKLQLVGATAILIAAKYEEINCPSIQEIAYMVDHGYTEEEILKAERFMLSLLQFELGYPGPMSFLRRVSKADDYDYETRTLAKYFLEVAIMDERFLSCPASFLAAGAHCLARIMLRRGEWTAAHTYYSTYTYSQLYPMISLLVECCENPRRHHPSVFEKYSDRRFKRAAFFVESEVVKGFRLPSYPRVSPRNEKQTQNRAAGYRRN